MKTFANRKSGVFFVLCFCIFASGNACESFKRKESVSLKCTLPGTRQITSCYSGDLPPGTILSYGCAPNYIPANTYIRNGQRTCNNRNRWTGKDQFETFSCSIDCGRSFEGLAPFVVGGKPTTRNEWPWHVSIFARLSPKSAFQYICGGTLVKPFSRGFIIITAAHCLAEVRGNARDPQNVKVMLGANFSSWEENDNLPNVQRHQVRQIVIHDSYAGESSYHQADIALVRVKDPIKLSENVLPACLSGGNDFAEIGTVGTVIGFGAYEYSKGTASKTLRFAKLPVADKDKCFEWRRRKLLPQEICAGYPMNISACNGDSGGGFVFPQKFNKVERYYLEGIVSHGRKNIDNKKEECDFFSVFTRVNSYDPWIRDKAEEMFAEDEDVGEENPSFPEIEEFPEEPQIKFGSTTTRPTAAPTTAPNNFRPTAPTTERQTRPPAPPPQQPGSNSIVDSNDYKSVGLDRHNLYRRMHGSPDLRLSERLNRHAQAYANKLLASGVLMNEPDQDVNKNVYRHSGSRVPVAPDIVRNAVETWYSSVKSYNWDNPRVSTFSQVVWKSTTEMGVGFATRNGVSFVVASYSPPGNVNGEHGRHYHENVFPALQTSSGFPK